MFINYKLCLKKIGLFVLAVGISLAANAERAKVKVTGFASLAATHSSSDDLNFSSTYLNEERNGFALQPDSILGFQVNANLTNKIQAVGQIVFVDSRRSDLENKIEIAFLRYQFNRHWAARIGRLNNSVYLVSEYKPVGHAFLWARPPMEFYSSSTVTDSLDGVDIRYANDLWGGYAKFGLSLGGTTAKLRSKANAIDIDFFNGITFHAEWQGIDWRFHSSYVTTKMRVQNDNDFSNLAEGVRQSPALIWPNKDSVADRLLGVNQRAKYASLGAKFDNSQSIWMTEVADYHSDWLLYPSSYSGYTTFGQYIGDWTPYVTFSFTRPKEPPFRAQLNAPPAALPPQIAQQIALLAATTELVTDIIRIDQKAISFGIRWDIKPKWAAKLQFNHARINNPGSGLIQVDNNQVLDENRHINIWHLSINTTF